MKNTITTSISALVFLVIGLFIGKSNNPIEIKTVVKTNIVEKPFDRIVNRTVEKIVEKPVIEYVDKYVTNVVEKVVEAEISPQHHITDIRMNFSSMVEFMVKWVFASIPALIILGLVFGLAGIVL